MGLGFSKGKGSSESWGKHGWEEPTQEIRQFLNDPEIEESAKAIAEAAGEAARKAAYDTAYTLSKEKVDEAKSKLEKNLSVVEAQKAQLELKVEEQAKDINGYKRAIAELTNQLHHAARREVELNKMEKQLQEEKVVLEEEKREILGIGAPAYQARKMYGDTVPGDITHTDVASKFSEFFKNYIRKLPKNNPDVSADNVKKLITPLFQEAFSMSCQYAMKIIQEQALTLFNDPSEMTEEEKSSYRVKEQQLDTSRAYSLLLYHADVKGRKENIIEELKAEMKSHLCDIAAKEGVELPDELITAAATITWEMVTIIPPAISCTPRKFDKHYNEQRNALWKVKKGPYELIYTRPVLFFGSDGHVGVMGQVGNKPCDPEGAVNFIDENSDDEDDELDQSQRREQDPLQLPQQDNHHPQERQQGDKDLQQDLQDILQTHEGDKDSQIPSQEDQDLMPPQQDNKGSQQPQHVDKDSQQLAQQDNQDPQQPQQGEKGSEEPQQVDKGSHQSQQEDKDCQQLPQQENEDLQQPQQGDKGPQQTDKDHQDTQQFHEGDEHPPSKPQQGDKDYQQTEHVDEDPQQPNQEDKDVQKPHEENIKKGLQQPPQQENQDPHQPQQGDKGPQQSDENHQDNQQSHEGDENSPLKPQQGDEDHQQIQHAGDPHKTQQVDEDPQQPKQEDKDVHQREQDPQQSHGSQDVPSVLSNDSESFVMVELSQNGATDGNDAVCHLPDDTQSGTVKGNEVTNDDIGNQNSAGLEKISAATNSENPLQQSLQTLENQQGTTSGKKEGSPKKPEVGNIEQPSDLSSKQGVANETTSLAQDNNNASTDTSKNITDKSNPS